MDGWMLSAFSEAVRRGRSALHHDVLIEISPQDGAHNFLNLWFL